MKAFLVLSTLLTTPLLAAENPAQPPTQTPAPQAATPQKNPPAATPAQPEAPRANIQLAGHDTKDRIAKKFFGDHVRGNDGHSLGTVKDFLLDPQTGKVDFAVISSGGIGGMGNKLRLTPIHALKRTAKKDEFTLNVSEEQWKGFTTLAEDEFKSGEITIPNAQRRQIAENFKLLTESASSDSSFYTASLTSHLVRASELADRNVRASSGKLGEIEAIVLDLEAGTAQALIDPNKDFTGISKKLLVPFNQFTISNGKRPEVTTLLTRSDFQQLHTDHTMATGLASSSASTPSPAQPPTAQPNAGQTKSAPVVASTSPSPRTNANSPTSPAQTTSAPSTSASSTPAPTTKSAVATNAPPAQQAQPQASNSTTPPTADRSDHTDRIAAGEKSPTTATAATPAAKDAGTLSPTGQSSTDTIPAGTDPLLVATAQAIRKALDADPALARADVRVTPEEGKIVLRGRVSDQKTKTAIIEKATSEVKGWKIDDQISIDNR